MEMMREMREFIIGIYKRYEAPVNMSLKFLTGFFIFFKLGILSSDNLSIAKVLMVALIFSALTSVSSCGVFFIFLITAIGIYLSFASIETALLVLLLLFLFFVFYVRLFPKQSLLIPALFIAYYFKVPYAVPIFVGIYMGIMGIIPVVIGVFLYSMIPAVTYFITLAPKAQFSPLNMPDAFIKIYVALCEYLIKNTQWITDAAIFAFVIIITYVIARITINFAKEFSIVVGGILTIIAYICAILIGNNSYDLLGIILGVVASALLVWFIGFFQDIPDYSKVEKIQFEDDENYYFVKVVPKYKSYHNYEEQKNFELSGQFQNINIKRRQQKFRNQKE